MKIFFGSLLLLLLAFTANGQESPVPPRFEVASVKPNATREPGSFEIAPERLSVHNSDLGHLIMRAYNIAERQFASVGSYLPILTGHYDIEAKAPAPAARTDMMRMLQTL